MISACSPATAAEGEVVTITGTGFGTLRRKTGVTFNGTAATDLAVTNERITVTVPRGATSGPLIVTDWEGTPSNEVDFRIRAP